MLSTSISKARQPAREWAFTLVELLVGLSIAICLATAIAPVWLSFQRTGEGQTDSTIWFLQARVAIARFERDLRLAGAAGCRFPVAGPVLEASASQVVLLERDAEGMPPIVVEWEIVNGALMRRWRPCPQAEPDIFAHSAYSDNKTMLDGVSSPSCIKYLIGGRQVAAPAAEADLASIEAVVLDLAGTATPKGPTVRESTTTWVGR